MPIKRLLLQLDADRVPSSFDRVVGYDAGADEVLAYGGVREQDVRALVHGAIFTRGPKDLHNTAIFVGGSDPEESDRLMDAVTKSFFGAFRVSVMADPNGNRTTAAAAVVKMLRALGGEAAGRRAVVLAGTGPVGVCAAGLLASEGAAVRITSRDRDRGNRAASQIRTAFGADVEVAVARQPVELGRAADGVEMLLSAGPAGVELLPRDYWAGRSGLRVAADVNAVPPLGMEGIDASDNGEDRGGVATFGALAIGRLKMKVHKAAIAHLFERNDLVLDAGAIYELAVAS